MGTFTGWGTMFNYEGVGRLELRPDLALVVPSEVIFITPACVSPSIIDAIYLFTMRT